MKLTHPKTSRTVEVKDGDEGIYLAQGWQESVEAAVADDLDED